jgi:hypothetical protein
MINAVTSRLTSLTIFLCLLPSVCTVGTVLDLPYTFVADGTGRNEHATFRLCHPRQSLPDLDGASHPEVSDPVAMLMKMWRWLQHLVKG